MQWTVGCGTKEDGSTLVG